MVNIDDMVIMIMMVNDILLERNIAISFKK